MVNFAEELNPNQFLYFRGSNSANKAN